MIHLISTSYLHHEVKSGGFGKGLHTATSGSADVTEKIVRGPPLAAKAVYFTGNEMKPHSSRNLPQLGSLWH